MLKISREGRFEITCESSDGKELSVFRCSPEMADFIMAAVDDQMRIQELSKDIGDLAVRFESVEVARDVANRRVAEALEREKIALERESKALTNWTGHNCFEAQDELRRKLDESFEKAAKIAEDAWNDANNFCNMKAHGAGIAAAIRSLKGKA